MQQVPMVLTIAGSETTGGAGMQADLKTFEEYGCHGMVALTSIVTMRTSDWAHEVAPIEPGLIQRQLDTILAGGRIAAMKTGMLPGRTVIELVQQSILAHGFGNVVIDPVMVCKADAEPLNVDSADALRELLIPHATVATPNLFEAGVLAGMGPLHTLDEVKAAAKAIQALGAKNVVVKGGKGLVGDEAVDVLYDGREFHLLRAAKVDNTYNQGAGCSFSAAIAAGLANGMDVYAAVAKAKDYVRAAIQHGFAFNQFTGPVYHAAYRLCEGKQPGAGCTGTL